MNRISVRPAKMQPRVVMGPNCQHQKISLGLICGLAISLVAGCGQVDQIEQHVMSRDRTGIPEAVRMPSAQQETTPAVRSRMVTAIASLPNATWFFKAVGPVAEMETALPSLTNFFQSVRFNAAGQPEYTTPSNWQKGVQRPGRFETLLLGTQETPSIELAISELGPNQDLTSNVNRWRKDQLGLSALDDAAARASLKSLAYQGGEFLLFDETGMYRGGMSGPLGGTGKQTGVSALPTAETTASPAESAGPASAAPPIEFVSPSGWAEIPNPMFAAVRLERVDGDKKAAISVSEMNPALNTWDSALGSWLTELELPGLDSAQVGPFVAEVTIDGQVGKQVRLLMPDAAKGIIAARVEQGGRAWFIKLSGDKAIVENSQADLAAFLQSIRFKAAPDSK